jgi:DNA-directed RNA polymerase subunit RPC12/RpoP
MIIRKLLYLPTVQQNREIQTDIEAIMNSCADIASREFKEQKENQLARDTRCPRCRERDVVDKIRNVEGSGKINGDFYLGFGNVSGRMKIETEAVNHCNECGHEWLKFKTKYISKTEIVRVALNYLGDYLKDPVKQQRMCWKMKAIEVFKDRSAEAIHVLTKKHWGYMRPTPRQTLKPRILRKYYPSIFKAKDRKK